MMVFMKIINKAKDVNGEVLDFLLCKLMEWKLCN